METIFINMENSKTNEPRKLVLNLALLDSRNANKYADFQNLSIHCTWKNMSTKTISSK